MGQNLTGQLISATYEDLVQISGSRLTDGTGSNINNLTVTSSFATNAATATSASFASTAISASFATTASFALNAAGTNTGSLMVTGSATSNVLTFTKGDGSTFNLTVATGSAVTVNTGSLMVTGSVSSNTLTFTKGDGSTFNLTVNTGSAVTINTGSFVTTASISNATTTYTKGDGSTFALTVNNVQNASTASVATSSSYAQNASTADSATSASFATNANTATSASFASTATSASFATSATSASFALTATSASYAVSASQAQNAVTASFALSTITGTSATASFTGSTWTFNHNLNKGYVIIDCYDSSDEEIIPQTIDLTTVNVATISFPVSVQGTAVASLGNALVPVTDPASIYSGLQSGATSVYRQKLDITTATTHNIYVSQSGIHWVDATQLASGTSANLNINVYPELFNTNDVAGVLFSYNSGSAAAVNFRTIVSASANYVYYGGGLSIGTTSTTLTRQTNNSVRMFGATNTNPTIFTKTTDGTVYMNSAALPIPALNYYWVGSQGTPIP